MDVLYTENFFRTALIISRPECADLAYAEYLMPGRHKSHPPRLAVRFKGESDWPHIAFARTQIRSQNGGFMKPERISITINFCKGRNLSPGTDTVRLCQKYSLAPMPNDHCIIYDSASLIFPGKSPIPCIILSPKSSSFTPAIPHASAMHLLYGEPEPPLK